MKNEVYQLVQNVSPVQQPLIYRVEEDGNGAWLYLVQTRSLKVTDNICLGFLVRSNKRGMTFRGHLLTPKPLEIFLSNGEFTRVNVE